MTPRAYLLDKDCLGGTLVALLKACAIAAACSHELGTLARMGPGFFPTAIGIVMLLTGVSILLTSLRRAPLEEGRVKRPDLRSWTLIPLSLLAFIVVGEQAGLLPRPSAWWSWLPSPTAGTAGVARCSWPRR